MQYFCLSCLPSQTLQIFWSQFFSLSLHSSQSSPLPSRANSSWRQWRLLCLSLGAHITARLQIEWTKELAELWSSSPWFLTTSRANAEVPETAAPCCFSKPINLHSSQCQNTHFSASVFKFTALNGISGSKLCSLTRYIIQLFKFKLY